MKGLGRKAFTLGALCFLATCGGRTDSLNVKADERDASDGGTAGAAHDAALDLAKSEDAATDVGNEQTLADGAIVRSCAEVLTTPIDGQDCRMNPYCLGYDACCSATTECQGGRLEASWSCAPPVTTGCTSQPNAIVSGTTPLGQVSFGHAWSGFSRGFLKYLKILFTTTSPAATCAARRMGVWIWFNGDYVGVHEVPVTLFVDGERRIADAQIRITSMGPAGNEPSGSIEVVGWNLKGSFSAPECSDFSHSGT